MSQQPQPPDMKLINGLKVFSATMAHQREALGETVTRWMEEAKKRSSSFQVVDIKVLQSSDQAFHCVTICVFYSEDRGSPKSKASKSPQA